MIILLFDNVFLTQAKYYCSGTKLFLELNREITQLSSSDSHLILISGGFPINTVIVCVAIDQRPVSAELTFTTNKYVVDS